MVRIALSLRVLAALAALAPVSGTAQIWRCEGAGGVVEYSNNPASGRSANCRTVDLPAITTIPAPRLPAQAPGARPPAASGGVAGAGAGSAGAAIPGGAAAGGFPRVEANAQRARDLDRRRILEDELRREESRLAELRGEFNGGEPERRGDERNYQKYLDRVQRLKEDIARSESAVASLRREMGALRD